MSYQKLLKERRRETRFINNRFSGDRKLYNIHKRQQEYAKRRRHNTVSFQELQNALQLHHQRFPTWFHVKDATEKYCSRPLVSSTCQNEPSRCLHVPIECAEGRDMYNILHTLLKNCDKVEKIHVTCNYGNETIHVPHKMVIMQHEEGNTPILEALKHQERDLSPMTIYNVVGGKFDDFNRGVLVTSEPLVHTRYLYKDWEKYQFHIALPKANTVMRLCYGITPESVSIITVVTKKVKFVFSRATQFDERKIHKQSVIGCLEAAELFL